MWRASNSSSSLYLLGCMLAVSACGAGQPSSQETSEGTGTTSETGETGETGESCEGEFSWQRTRTDYPSLVNIGSDGEGFIASYNEGMLSFDGEPTWYLDPELVGEVAGEFVLRSTEDAWVRGSGGALLHWDGASFDSTLSGLSDISIRVAADGEVYAMGHVSCNQFNCAPRFWQWDGGPWVELDNSEFQRGVDMWALPGGELWAVGADGNFAHRVDGGWSLEQYGDGSFDPDFITVDGEGHVYALGYAGEWVLLRRESEGVWLEQPLGHDGDEVLRLIPEQDAVLIVRQDHPRVVLSRWGGQGEPSVLWDSALALPEVDYVRNAVGSSEEIFVLANGPSVYRVHPSDAGQSPELLFESPDFRARPGASAGVDATFEREGRKLRRWDLDAQTWVDVFDLDEGGLSTGIIGELWAEGPEAVIFVLVEDGNEQLWRWAEGEGGPMAAQPQGDSYEQLWGRSLDQLWLLGQREELAQLWRFDGQAWIEESTPVEEGLALGGDEDELFIVGADGRVWGKAQGEAWSQLGEPLNNELDSAVIIRLGEELYVFATWLIYGDFTSSRSELYRFEDGSWEVYEGLPAGILASGYVADQWAWAVTRTTDPVPELYMREAGADSESPWQLVELGAQVDYPAEVFVAEDGVLLHDGSHTAVYSCAD